jgi:hypothetical protein
MVCIIAGSRLCTRDEVFAAIQNSGIAHEITEVVWGMCPKGGDLYGKEWADLHSIPVTPFKPEWDNIDAPGAVIKYRNGKPYNVRAGFDRNEKMAVYAAERKGSLIAVLKGKSDGTMDMIRRAQKHNLTVHSFRVEFL